MQQKVQKVKLEFHKMIKQTLMAYTNGVTRDLMVEFKGNETQSGHMAKYIKWYPQRNIFMLLDKDKFKHEAKSYYGELMYRQTYYQRLIYYPSVQNFIHDKFFPQSVLDNIRQMHTFPELDFEKNVTESKKNESKGGRS